MYPLKVKIRLEVYDRMRLEPIAATIAATPFSTSPGRKGRTAIANTVAADLWIRAPSHSAPLAKISPLQATAPAENAINRDRFFFVASSNAYFILHIDVPGLDISI